MGDQFAMLEATVALAILLQRLNFQLVPNQTIGMTTGATIHTTTVSCLKNHIRHVLLVIVGVHEHIFITIH